MTSDLFDDAFDEQPVLGFAYLDGRTKRRIRRALLKAVCIPGYQAPFDSREIPLPPGWGTGGIQITAALLVPEDRLKVIDQGADDATNAVAIRGFFRRVAAITTTDRTLEATLIQTRHRVPETPLTESQILVLQVPEPEPLRHLEPVDGKTRRMHALADYGLAYLGLYESIARFGQSTITYDYPVLVHERYIASPSPIPTFDNHKLNNSAALALFGAGREKRLYAIPPYTKVESLQLDDHPFRVQRWAQACSRCGATDSYLEEAGTDRRGNPVFCCSDTDYCTAQVSQNAAAERPIRTA